MDKLKMQTKDKVDVNVETIGKLFPNTVTETIKGYTKNNQPIIEKAIDFEILKQELSKVIVDGNQERYQMNWPGKKRAILEANSPINMTLRPCRSESVNFDTTENLYIEGDNLQVLKLLQETYLNKVKMIYIDPPYNKRNDSFVYPDNFAMSSEEFSQASYQYDEDGNMMFDIRKNNESNGKFHTDWLNMMYPRLKLAKDLLSDDGVIFISIDDNEVHNLRKICDEVFGEDNFVNIFLWTKTSTPPSLSNKSRKTVEFILCYEKIKNNYRYYDSQIDNGDAPLLNTGNPIKTLVFPPKTIRFTYMDNGSYKAGQYEKVKLINDIIIKNGQNYNKVIVSGKFKWGSDNLKKEINAGTHFLIKSEKFSIRFQRNKDTKKFKAPNNFFSNIELNKNNGIGTNESAVKELIKLNLKDYFDYPKPTSLLEKLIKMITYDNKNGIILDFFSGSATTAHAVMKLNAEDGGKRKFIMVQLPEPTDKKSEAYKAGYKNICEIGKERIRRAGKKIKEENPDKTKDLDIGFRVLKLDSSNMKDVFYKPDEYNQNLIDNFKENIKEDRSSEDLLFQVMLELGELLSSDIEQIEIEGKKVFNVGQGSLIACFDNDITDKVVEKIAKMEPFYAVFRDSSLSNDAVATNFEQIFKTYSPSTIRKIL